MPQLSHKYAMVVSWNFVWFIANKYKYLWYKYGRPSDNSTNWRRCAFWMLSAKYICAIYVFGTELFILIFFNFFLLFFYTKQRWKSHFGHFAKRKSSTPLGLGPLTAIDHFHPRASKCIAIFPLGFHTVLEQIQLYLEEISSQRRTRLFFHDNHEWI